MLYERFQRQAELHPQRPAILHDGRIVSYAELRALSLRVAAGLNFALAPAREDRLRIAGLLFEPGADMIGSVLGALAAGIVYVPLDPHYPQNRLQHMLVHSECGALLTNRSTLARARALIEQAPNVELLSIEDLPAANRPCVLETPAANRPAYILYTSGSSGRPKGVLQSCASLLYFAEQWIESSHSGVDDRVTMLSSLSHDASIPDLFGSVLSGATLCVYDVHNDGLRGLAPWLKQEAITVWHSVPTLFRLFTDGLVSGDVFPDLRLVVFGGETVRDSDIELVRSYCPEAALTIIYGQSESTINSLWTLEKHEKPAKISLGRPFGTTRLFLADEQGAVIEEFGRGEIVVASKHVAIGYWRDEETSAHAFTSDERHGRLFWTGDVGILAGDGSIRFAGRRDAQLKIRGHRIEPAEIEGVLQSHSAISNSAVVAQTDATGNNELHAFLVSDEPIATDVLRQLLWRELPDYMVPRWFTRLEQLPLLASGKVDRAKLAREIPAEIKRETLPLRSEVERQLAAIWRRLLKVNEIGAHSDFFDLGGQSLLIIDLLSAIHEKFQVDLSFKDVVRYRTIQQLAKLIEDSGPTQPAFVTRAETREFYELSSAQKRIFVLCQFDHIGTTYNMPLAVDVEGSLDPARLRQATRELIRRHESLRTSFHLVGGRPVQVIHDDAECEIEELRVGDDEIEASLEELVRPFDLGRAPLLRFKILIRGENRFTILSDIHHIICDGASREVLVRDLLSLYGGATLPPLEVGYKDYAVWQAHLTRSGALQAQEKYWLDLLAGGAPALNLPGDFERPEAFSFRGSTLKTSLSEQATERLRNLAAAQGATLFMTTLAAFSLVLQERTRQPDIVVGVSVDGRRHRGLRPLVGMFVNELLVWNRPRAELRFCDFLSEVRSNSLQALANSDVQFEHLVQQLNPERDLSRNPLFSVCVSMAQSLPRTIDPVGMQFVRRATASHFSKFDLTLFIREDGDRLHLDFEYCTDLFLPATIAGLARQLAAVIDTVCRDPEIPLADIGFAGSRPTSAQREQPKQPLAQSAVHQLIERQCGSRPSAIALRQGARQLSYRELDERANQVAHYLRDQKGIRRGECVALLLDNSFELVVAILGVLKAGAAYVPIDPTCPEERVCLILNETGARVVLSQRKLVRLLNRLQWECPHFEAFCCLDSSDINNEVERAANALMDEELWNYVASVAGDDITGGGWMRSDTGLPFSSTEMSEYVENAFRKISPLLHPRARVLEVGCGSGLTLFRVAPLIGSYHATDLSPVMAEMTAQKVQAEGLQNVKVECLPAHKIDQLGETQFDLIILNSVVQSFHGHNYLRAVLGKAISLLKETGHIFLGDVMDADRKAALLEWLEDFARTQGNSAKTKIDWSAELFVSRTFFQDLRFDFPEIIHVETSDKSYTIENELTRFRFDALLTVDRRSRSVSVAGTRRKWQDDLRAVNQCATTPVETEINVEDVAYVIYTSGTTGQPKGVVVEHRSLANYVTWARKAYQISPDSIFALCTPVSFDLTLTALFVPLTAGGSVRIHEAGNTVLSVTEALQDDQVTAIKLTPSHLDLLSVASVPAQSRLRTFVLGGEDLKAASARLIEDRFSPDVRVFNEYGPTEATVGCMVYRFDRRRDRYTSVPIGEAIDNVSVYILDERQRPVAEGTAGELYIAGAAVARGYLKRPAETAQVFLPDPFKPDQRLYRTGDLAWRRPNQSIEFLGRVDDQLKIHGHRIELREIEACILTHPDVTRAALVVVKESGARQKELCAYFVARRELTDDELRSFLKRRLPDYMIPQRCIRTAELRFNDNGKLDRRGLAALAPAPQSDLVKPQTVLERRLAQIWSEVLGISIERLGLDTDFFAAGGHSLSAVALISRVRSELKLQSALADVFNFPRLGEFAQQATRSRRRFAEGELVTRAELREYYPASRSQQSIYRKHALHPEKYNRDPIIYELRGVLDLERFNNALRALLARYEILRTSFQEAHGQIVQRIHEDLEPPLEMREGTAEDVYEIWRSWRTPFRLEDPPLWRVLIIRIEPKLHYLCFDLHHILYDADSVGFLLEDFGRLYCGAEPLPPLDLQYKDYAVWEQRDARRTGSATEELRHNARELLKPAKLPSQAGLDRLSGHGMLEVSLDRDAHAALKCLSRQLSCTRLSILLAAFFQIVSRETGDDTVAVALRVSTRRKHELQRTVGPFLTKVLLQERVLENESLSRLAKRLQQNVLSTLDHRHAVADGPAPVSILVNYQTLNDARGSTFGPHVTVTPFRQPFALTSSMVPYDFVLAVFDHGSQVSLRALYDQALYSPRFVRQLLNDIGGALREPDSAVELEPVLGRNQSLSFTSTSRI